MRTHGELPDNILVCAYSGIPQRYHMPRSKGYDARNRVCRGDRAEAVGPDRDVFRLARDGHLLRLLRGNLGSSGLKKLSDGSCRYLPIYQLDLYICMLGRAPSAAEQAS